MCSGCGCDKKPEPKKDKKDKKASKPAVQPEKKA
jgi:hypothetical protein